MDTRFWSTRSHAREPGNSGLGHQLADQLADQLVEGVAPRSTTAKLIHQLINAAYARGVVTTDGLGQVQLPDGRTLDVWQGGDPRGLPVV